MDKNTFIGLLLIGAIVLGFSYFNRPTEAEIARQQEIRDSIATVEQQRIKENVSTITEEEIVPRENISAPKVENDSVNQAMALSLYGIFADANNGENKEIDIETDLLKLKFSTKGAVLKEVILKDYKTYDGRDLVLMDSTSRFNLNFFTRESKDIFTDELIFTTEETSFNVYGESEKNISFYLQAANEQYLEFIYTIKGNSYSIDFDVNLVGMDQIIDMRKGELLLEWSVNAPNQEKSLKPQRDATTIFYKYKNEDVDDIGIADEVEKVETRLKWISFKQQFFNTTLIADDFFENEGKMITETDEGSENYVKRMSAQLVVPVTGSKIEKFGMSLYLGPNKYEILADREDELKEIINLGWGIFGWVNKFAVIPVFNLLDSSTLSYGIIILILTILLKLVLMPITYKTYLSGAKMRVLKPEISEINEKHKDDAMKKQQAMMSLYKQTGVNPLSGCIPMLIQMPILFAMFRFFPASIELRQEKFLWADDLSTYDSIYDFPAGFSIPWYGDHISLFTLLMAISIMFYTKMNSQMTGGGMTEGPMAAQMKMMTYLMPVMMLFFFNNYAAGLSYYYFLANIISIGQTLLIRKVFINEESIRAKIETNKKRPMSTKKSGFQKRLEEMAKQKGIQPPKKK